ncbi:MULTISPECIES: tripartite tricarboxylate transporter substrate binding protein [unclassified Achromobacter]|uniref:Bug family tripartite tricarboxylate transporter substrate binding protein n=1 Tax=unclassified Achromobacter TaxID=2626865 RepID=UPI000B519009|nr:MULTISPECIES: tripartite tricarboxylate transporter substrate-binding protein [unclassified Achromobacter]OWT73669.1 ABC transporter substrate-binding protein [Achromobacter sp. HZ34]OWT79415.1 ABC transporter substrate-binding protein [Achromobacter sp. HZ28]
MLRFLTRVCALALVAGTAHAAYPDHPIRMIVPFAPGGGADVTARVVADTLGKKLGQPVIVENKAGAGGMIGAAAVARAEADGYTLLYTTPGQQMTLPYLMKTMPYDPADLRPVSQVSLAPSVLVVNKKLGVNSLQQLIELARKSPGELNFVSAGIGASSHLNGELLQILAGIRLQHIPYKGTGDAVKDLVGGNGDIAIDTVGIYTSFIKDGRLIPLGVTTAEELPLLPGVPPMSKTLPGYDASPINYITVPKATPEAIVQKLSAALQATIAEPDVKQRMLDQGILAIANTPEQMAELLRKEQTRWREVIEKAHIPKQ